MSQLSFKNRLWIYSESSDTDLYQQILTNRKDLNLGSGRLKDSMPHPQHLPEVEKLVGAIRRAKEQNLTIGIFGDYDADGLTSVAMWQKCLRMLGIKTKVYVPDRSDGYGASKAGLVELAGSDIILFLDCGSNSGEIIDQIEAEVYVLDHHKVTSVPKKCTLINPYRPDYENQEQYQSLCTAGLSFLVLALIRAEFGFDKKFILDLAGLAAIGTIGDVMPLTGFNRALVKQGLHMMHQCRGVSELSNLLGLGESLTSGKLGFYIVPCINAAGRIARATVALDLLCEVGDVEKNARTLCALNEQRKVLEKNLLNAAEARLDLSKRVLILHDSTWHPGLVGIIAGRIKEAYGKTSFVFWKSDNTWKGSARGKNVGELITKSVEAGLAEAGGGHCAAGGVSVHEDKFELWADWIQSNCEINGPETVCVDAIGCERSVSQLKFLQELGPFGAGNPNLKIVLKNSWIKHVRQYNDHLQIQLHSGYRFFAFKSATSWGQNFKPGECYDLMLSVDESGDPKIEDGMFVNAT